MSKMSTTTSMAASRRLLETPFQGDDITRTARVHIDHKISQAYSEISILQTRVSALKKKRNELSITHTLPPEILSKIFLLRQQDDTGCTWMRVGHVCYYWREVTLSCPRLWSKPLFNHRHPELTHEMLKRSKQVPLTVDANMVHFTPRMMDQLASTLSQLSRIRTLSVQKSEPHCERLQEMMDIFIGPAPFLHDVSFKANFIFLNDRSVNTIIPDEAFKEAHSLRSVKINCFGFSWKCGLFKHSSLTKLDICSHDKNPHVVGSSAFIEMLDALDNMPHLSSLTLDETLPRQADPPSGYVRREVHLKELQQLDIIADTQDCATFLRHVRFPANTEVYLNCDSHTEAEDLDASVYIISTIGKRLQGGFAVGERGIHQKLHTFPSAIVCFPGPGFQPFFDFKTFDTVECHSSHIDICIKWYEISEPARERIWKETFANFNFSEIRNLSLHNSPGNLQFFRETVGQCSKLEKIHLASTRPTDLKKMCEAVHEDALQIENVPNPIVTMLPVLKMIHINARIFRGTNFPLSLELVTDLWKKRRISNAPLQWLVLRHCHGTIDALKQEVISARLAESAVRSKIMLEMPDEDDFSDWDEEPELYIGMG